MKFRKSLYRRSLSKWFSLRMFVCFMILCSSINVYAEDEILSLDGARIRGNQELPNVLYLIPWKPPKVYSLQQANNTPTTDSKLKMLERSSFKRLVSYHQAFIKHKASENTDNTEN